MSRRKRFGQRHHIRRVTAPVTLMKIGEQDFQGINPCKSGKRLRWRMD
jgi:hypothetical protein